MISRIKQEEIYQNRNLKVFASSNKQALQFKICLNQPNGKEKQLHTKLQSQKQLQQKHMELDTYEQLKKFIKQNSVVQVDLQQNIMVIKDKNQNNLLNKIQIQLDGGKQPTVTSSCMELILQKCSKKQSMQSDDIKEIFESIAQALQMLQINTSNYNKISTRQQIKIRDNMKHLHRNVVNKPVPSLISQNSIKAVEEKVEKEIKQNYDKYMKKLTDNELKLDVRLTQVNQSIEKIQKIYNKELSDIKIKIAGLENSKIMKQDHQSKQLTNQIMHLHKKLNDYVAVTAYSLDFSNFSARIQSLQACLQPKPMKKMPFNLMQWIDEPNLDDMQVHENRIKIKKDCEIYSKLVIKQQYKYLVKVIKKQYYIALGIKDRKIRNNKTPSGAQNNEIIFNNYGECYIFGKMHNKDKIKMIKDNDQVTVYVNRMLGFIQWSINGTTAYKIKNQVILDRSNIDWVPFIALDYQNDAIAISQL